LLGEYVVGIDEDFREYVYLNGQPLALYRKQSGLVVPPPVELIIDNGDTGTSQNGQWLLKTDVQMYGPDYLEAKKKASNTYTWTTVPPGTEYSVYAWWVASNGYADNVEYTIGYGFGQTATVYENQQINGGQWNLMGQYGAGSGPYFVEVNAADGKTSTDAIKLVYQPEPYFDSVETTAFIHADHLGTPRAVSDATQTIIWRWDSSPFGDTMPNEDPDGDSNAFTLNLRFPGQYYDAESGLHYNYFRDYDPSMGRYIESDPTGLRGGVNVFNYVSQSPEMLVDPYGLDELSPTYRGGHAYGTPVCNQGKLDIKWFDLPPCLADCLMVHEQFHIEMIKSRSVGICRGVEFAYIVDTRSQARHDDEEASAQTKELNCLEKSNQMPCNSDECTKERQDRIDYLKFLLRYDT
jgi:RHS repeat-associated protein